MKLHYQDDVVKLWQGDVLAWALWYRGEIEAGRAEPFHSILPDPPYGLSDPPPIEKVLTAWLAGGDFDYKKKGFMGKAWDSLPPGPKYWRALLDITYPGGYLFAFSGTRTADLLGIACRLGGWEPFDRIASFGWVQGQGMAKGANMGKALDKENGKHERDLQPFGDYVRELRQAKGWSLRQLDNEMDTNTAASWWEGRKSGIRPPGLKMYQKLKTVLNMDGRFDELIDWLEAEREIVGQGYRVRNESCVQIAGVSKGNFNITVPATPLAKQFDGYGSQISPKHEPILLFRKPRGGRTFAECAREFGSGGLDLDSCRVKSDTPVPMPGGRIRSKRNVVSSSQDDNYELIEPPPSNPAGRFPPNTHFTHNSPRPCHCQGDDETCEDCSGSGLVGGCQRVGSKRVETSTGVRGASTRIYGGGKGFTKATGEHVGYADADGREEVADWECEETCAVFLLDEMAGERKSGTRKPRTEPSSESVARGNFDEWESKHYQGSAGGPSRFFPQHDWSYEIAERLAGETPYKYVSKASRGERDAGCQDLPLVECQQGCGGDFPTDDQGKERDRFKVIARNTHMCVKPISLIKWLATLACPPPEVKPRICIPYAGSGSEIIGAILAGGWAEIHGIERELEYVEIAAARIAWWSKWAKLTHQTDPAAIRKLAESAEKKIAPKGDEHQTSLFDEMGL